MKKIFNIFKKISKMIIYTIIAFIVIITLFVNFAPTFGDSPKNGDYKKIKDSVNYNGKKFVNLVPTGMMMNGSGEDGSMKDLFFPKKEKNPDKPLPSKKFKKEDLKNDSFVWLGHSTILMKTQNTTIITDPLFNRASPLPIGGKAFEYENKTQIDDLPNIDVVVISHDHYDHLDHKAVQKLDKKVEKFFVPLGVKAHLMKWGIDKNKIDEKDWYEDINYKNINFTLVPSRHFSGRGLTNRDSTLWGGWVIKSSSKNIYFTGDSGYFDEFKKIGKNYGPFDIAFIENGAYNSGWAHIHMMPEESIQAGQDAKAKVLFPIHWSKFDLAYHNWDEPIIRFTNEAEKKNLTIATPLVGQVFTLDNLPQDKWWEELRK